MAITPHDTCLSSHTATHDTWHMTLVFRVTLPRVFQLRHMQNTWQSQVALSLECDSRGTKDIATCLSSHIAITTCLSRGLSRNVPRHNACRTRAKCVPNACSRNNACRMRAECAPNACLMRVSCVPQDECVPNARRMRAECAPNACRMRAECAPNARRMRAECVPHVCLRMNACRMRAYK